MNKAEYLSSLRKMLRNLPPGDVNDALDYYNGYLSDAEDEAAAIARLGSPGDVAAQILANYVTKNTETPYSASKGVGVKAAWGTLLVFLSIVALPFAITAFILVISLGVTILALGFSGAAAVLAGVLAIALVPFVISQSLVYAITTLGSGLAAIGLGILLIEATKYLWRAGVTGILKLVGKKVSLGGR